VGKGLFSPRTNLASPLIIISNGQQYYLFSLFCAITVYCPRMNAHPSEKKTEPGELASSDSHYSRGLIPSRNVWQRYQWRRRGGRRRGPCLHTGLLSGRVNTPGSALNKCHSQRGRSGPSPPARLRADNPSETLLVGPSCGSGVGRVGEERYCSGSGVDYNSNHTGFFGFFCC